MDPRTQSSFIPKKPIVTTVRRSRAPMSFFSIIAVTLFVVALLGCVGEFLYQNYLNAQISAASANFTRAEAEFDPSTLTDLIRLDSRLNIADALLKNHDAISNFFTELEKVTLQSVRFSNFSFSIGDKGALSVAMDGEAEDFTSIALQSDALIKDVYFKNVTVSNFTVEQSGAVAFNAAFTIDPSLVSYASDASSAQTNTVPAQSTDASAASSTDNSQTQ